MKKVKVAIQGSIGSFHDQAAFRLLGENIELIECLTFKESFEAFTTHQAEYVVVAVENTVYGPIASNFKLIEDYFCKVIDEVSLKIRLNLMAPKGLAISDITEIASHPIALAQCKGFLQNHPNVTLIESPNTALAAREISEKSIPNRAAIANDLCADLYNLSILESDIQDEAEDFTRFLLLESAIGMKKSLNAAIPSLLQINQLRNNTL